MGRRRKLKITVMSKAKNESHKQLLKRFHTLCGRAGMTQEDKEGLIARYGVESSADIPVVELRAICDRLDTQKQRQQDDHDKLRKRVIAAIGGWLRTEGLPETIAIIKGIACRATKYEAFNDIPAERLRNLYNLFLKKQKDKTETDKVVRDIVIDYYGSMNIKHNKNHFTN